MTTSTWDSPEAAAIWRQGAARRAQTLAVATERLFEAAGLAPGMRVLDVAAGTGDQSILAAQRVGPGGSVLATDISGSMLAVATEAARSQGLTNVTTRVADASTLDLGNENFDAAICRFGLMFLPDVHQALVRIRQALKPGAKFAALVWSTEERNPWIGLQTGLVRESGRVPTPLPSIFRTVSLSDPARLERAFSEASFNDVSVSAVPVPREFESLDEAWRAIQSSSPAAGELTREMNDAERERYATELKHRLADYLQADGRVLLPGEALLAVGTN